MGIISRGDRDNLGIIWGIRHHVLRSAGVLAVRTRCQFSVIKFKSHIYS